MTAQQFAPSLSPLTQRYLREAFCHGLAVKYLRPPAPNTWVFHTCVRGSLADTILCSLAGGIPGGVKQPANALTFHDEIGERPAVMEMRSDRLSPHLIKVKVNLGAIHELMTQFA